MPFHIEVSNPETAYKFSIKAYLIVIIILCALLGVCQIAVLMYTVIQSLLSLTLTGYLAL